MTDPINNGNNLAVGKILNEGLRGRQQTVAAEPKDRNDRTDERSASGQTQLSDRLQSIRATIDRSPDVDMDRVREIRQSIAEGNYPLDADRIASKFSDFETLLR